MITSVFKKSTPINYSLILILVLGFFFLSQFQDVTPLNSWIEVVKKIGSLGVIIASFFLVNFIAKKNKLTKDSGYTIFFFLIFMLFFPKVWRDYDLLLANFFILVAMRRLVSLQTLKASKEKIFDASLWIFVASLFNFWCVLFLLVVYISIVFHVSRDYRNWLAPFVALFTTIILFVFYALLFDSLAIQKYLTHGVTNFKLDYFTSNYQNLALSIYAVMAVFFVIPMIFSLTNRPLNLRASYKKLIVSFFLGITIFVVSTNKSNNLLLFTFFPMAVCATNTIEFAKFKWQQETILAVAFLLGLISFFTQL